MQLEFLAVLDHAGSLVLSYGVWTLSYKLAVHSLLGSFPPSDMKKCKFWNGKDDILTTLKTVLGGKKTPTEKHTQNPNT